MRTAAGNPLGHSIDFSELESDAQASILLIATSTPLIAAATSIDFSGLSGYKKYIAKCNIKGTISDRQVSLFVNNDTTIANYDSQRMTGAGAGVAGQRGSTAHIFNADIAANVFADVMINLDENGYFQAHSNYNQNDDAAIETGCNSITKISTIANITQLTFTSTTANGLEVGSTISLYGVRE